MGIRDEEGRAEPGHCYVYQLFPRSEKLNGSDENAGKGVLHFGLPFGVLSPYSCGL